ncbi:unnamed protein product [Cercopithifilaria johnstoni]|uniref:RING-type domain-containing protein n=1 Tax=Cercopithifilaria johnstoni TaxID=2874296 RepID=A0A8J2M3G0_9BILA|nr:unnamed protein product [Cercopithifilaria johnstoni]
MLSPLRDLLRNTDLQSLVPKCGGCSENFDAFLHMPYILSCCHTLCLICLTQEQTKKRRCLICRAKYTKYTMNSALLSLIIQIRELIICYQRSSAFCEECGKQTIIIDMRRCCTCEIKLYRMLKYSLQTRCICLQCCVEHHNGHILQEIFTTLNKSENNTTNKSFLLTTKCIHHKFKTMSIHSKPSSSISFTSKTSDSTSTQIVRIGSGDSCAEYVNISTNGDSELKFLSEVNHSFWEEDLIV